MLVHYYKKWTSAECVKFYKSLKRVIGASRARILQDNERTGFKSRAALAYKDSVGWEVLPFPCYSPDLNPLDFAVFAAAKKEYLQVTTRI